MHEMHLISFTIYIRSQPVILFITKGEKKKKRMLLGCTSSLPACLVLEDQALTEVPFSSLLTIKEVKGK